MLLILIPRSGELDAPRMGAGALSADPIYVPYHEHAPRTLGGLACAARRTGESSESGGAECDVGRPWDARAAGRPASAVGTRPRLSVPTLKAHPKSDCTPGVAGHIRPPDGAVPGDGGCALTVSPSLHVTMFPKTYGYPSATRRTFLSPPMGRQVTGEADRLLPAPDAETAVTSATAPG